MISPFFHFFYDLRIKISNDLINRMKNINMNNKYLASLDIKS